MAGDKDGQGSDGQENAGTKPTGGSGSAIVPASDGRSLTPPDAKKSPSGRPGVPGIFDPQSQLIIQQMLSNQTEELRLKSEELKLRAEEQRYNNEDLKRQHDFSMQAISAQVTDQKDQRTHIAEVTTKRYWFMFAAGLLVTGVLVCALLSGNKDFALEALKLVAAFGGGTGTGYAFGRKARARQQSVEGASPEAEPESQPAPRR